MLEIVLLLLLTLGMVLIISYRCIHPGSILYIIDQPNERSLHDKPTPRAGGVAIFTAILTAWLLLAFLNRNEVVWLVLPVMLLVLLGIIDDLKNLSPTIRFMTHLVLAYGLVHYGFGLSNLSLAGYIIDLPVWVLAGISLVFVVWMLNLYNFMDGMDGFAAGMSLFGFLTFAIMGFIKGADGFALMSLVVSCACAGFLWFNFPPARLFMGDGGSVPLGYVVAFMMLWADKGKIFSIWISIIVFSPFIMDASITLIKRAIKRERIWKAHKSHYYQMLVNSGWSHKRTLIFEYFLMVVCSGFAIIAVLIDEAYKWTIFATIISLYGLLIAIFHMIGNENRK